MSEESTIRLDVWTEGNEASGSVVCLREMVTEDGRGRHGCTENGAGESGKNNVEYTVGNILTTI